MTEQALDVVDVLYLALNWKWKKELPKQPLVKILSNMQVNLYASETAKRGAKEILEEVLKNEPSTVLMLTKEGEKEVRTMASEIEHPSVRTDIRTEGGLAGIQDSFLAHLYKKARKKKLSKFYPVEKPLVEVRYSPKVEIDEKRLTLVITLTPLMKETIEKLEDRIKKGELRDRFRNLEITYRKEEKLSRQSMNEYLALTEIFSRLKNMEEIVKFWEKKSR